MLPMSKTFITNAVLLSCLLLGVLLALTGTRKTQRATTAQQALRGSATYVEEASKARLLAQVTAAAQRQRVLVELQPTALNAEVDGDVADEIAEAPEPVAGEDKKTVSGEEEENAVLSWPEQGAETNGFWGPDNKEREQLANFVAKGTWDRLDEIDEPLSFSFDY